MENVFPYSIYAIKKGQDLEIAVSNGKGLFTENQTWKEGQKLLYEAQKSNQNLPILFGLAEEDSGIAYVAYTDSIKINDKQTEYSVFNIRKLKNRKPLNQLILKSTGKPLSDNFIHSYAICNTPNLCSWLQETCIPSLVQYLKTGSEFFTIGNKVLDFQLVNFWQWAYSDLVDNTLRGVLAEYIIAKALDIELKPRVSWQPYDFELPNGIKIEVKSAAYLQSWNQKQFSPINFSIQKTLAWNEFGGTQNESPKRQADVYIFCLLRHNVQDTLNPLNLSQWEFYVLQSRVLNEKMNDAKSISLTQLKKLGIKSSSFSQLKTRLEEIKI